MISHSYVSLLEVTAKFTSRSFWSESDPNAGQYAICFWNIPAMSRSCMFPLKTSSHTGFHGISHITMVFLYVPMFFHVFLMFFLWFSENLRHLFVTYHPRGSPRVGSWFRMPMSPWWTSRQRRCRNLLVGAWSNVYVSIYIYMQGGAPQVMFVGL